MDNIKNRFLSIKRIIHSIEIESSQNSIHQFLDWIEERNKTLFNQFLNKDSGGTNYLLEDIQKLFDVTSDEEKRDYQSFLDSSTSMSTGILSEKIQIAIQTIQKDNHFQISKKSPLKQMEETLAGIINSKIESLSSKNNNNIYEKCQFAGNFFGNREMMEEIKLQDTDFFNSEISLKESTKNAIKNSIKDTRMIYLTDGEVSPQNTHTPKFK